VLVEFTDGRPLPDVQLSRIRVGETTKSEILDWFGAPVGFSDSTPLESLLGTSELQPEDVLELPFADALVFRFTRARLEAAYFLVFLDADVRVASDTLVVFFDDQDRVLYYGYSRQTPGVDAEPLGDE